MDTDLEITLLTLLSTVILLGGIGFILGGGPLLAVAGVVLVILSAIVLLIDMRDIIAHWGRSPGTRTDKPPWVSTDSLSMDAPTKVL